MLSFSNSTLSGLLSVLAWGLLAVWCCRDYIKTRKLWDFTLAAASVGFAVLLLWNTLMPKVN